MTTELAQQLIKLCYAIVGVIAVVGALNVYTEMNKKDNGHAKRDAAITVSISVLLSVVATVIERIWL